jgi:hypothetical protein
VRGNVCANAAYAGFNFNSRACSGFADCLPTRPIFRGADIAIPAEWEKMSPQPPIIEARDNETYASAVGAWISFNGSVGTFRDFLGWHLSQAGVYASRLGYVDFVNIKLINDPEISSKQEKLVNMGLDIGATNYRSGAMNWRDITIEGFTVGMEVPAQRGGTLKLWPNHPNDTMEFVNVTLRNWVNVIDLSVIGIDSKTKTTNFRSSVFETYGSPMSYPRGVFMVGGPNQIVPNTPHDFIGWTGENSFGNMLLLPSRLISYDHQKSGQDIEFFNVAQAPDFVMPERMRSTIRLVNMNCPTPGLTNAECMATHGVSTMGRLATCTDSHPKAIGYLCGGSIVPPPPPPPPPPPADDFEFVLGGRKWTVQDAGPSTATDSAIRLNGVEYTLTPADDK